MPQYVEANSLRDVRDYLDGTFDTQLFRSLCVDITRFLPNRYVPDKRTMQANRDRFERKQLLQVFGEPDYDSPLMSASKAEQKRKSSPATTKDRSDKKRVKSVKKTSSTSKSKTIPQHKQCKRAGCVNRGTSVTHTHAQCFYKTAEKKGASPTTNLMAKKESSHHSHSVHIFLSLEIQTSIPMENRAKQRRDTTTSTHTLMTKKTERLLHQGARKWSEERKIMKNTIRRKNSLWTHSSYPLFLTHGSSCVTKKVTKSLTRTMLALTT